MERSFNLYSKIVENSNVITIIAELLFLYVISSSRDTDCVIFALMKHMPTVAMFVVFYIRRLTSTIRGRNKNDYLMERQHSVPDLSMCAYPISQISLSLIYSFSRSCWLIVSLSRTVSMMCCSSGAVYTRDGTAVSAEKQYGNISGLCTVVW
jgi:hypothetical protein